MADVLFSFWWADRKGLVVMPCCFTLFVIPCLPEPESAVVEQLDTSSHGHLGLLSAEEFFISYMKKHFLIINKA